MAVTVQRLEAADWRTFRELRLAALADAPDAFWATLQDESRHTGEEWLRFLAAAAWFVARRDGTPVGLVGGLQRADTPGEPEVIGMWVEPDERGQGTADLLLRAVRTWAEAAGAGALGLWVAVGNTAAGRLYERAGFRLTGERERFPPPREHITEERMRQPLSEP